MEGACNHINHNSGSLKAPESVCPFTLWICMEITGGCKVPASAARGVVHNGGAGHHDCSYSTLHGDVSNIDMASSVASVAPIVA